MLPSKPSELLAQYSGLGIIIGIVLVYLVIVLGIGYWGTRKTKSAKDFFIAGKSLGMVTMGLAMFAATMSGWLFVGLPGLLYNVGTGAMWFTLTTSICYVLLWVILGKRMRLLAEVRDTVTMGDAIDARYQSRAGRGLAAFATFIGVVLYLATQVLAMGIILGYVFDIPVAWGVIIGMVITLVYSVGGGILAGIYNDVFQGSIMAIAAIIIFVVAMVSGGGMENITNTIASSTAGAFGKVPGLGSKFVGPFGVLPPIMVMNWFFLLAMGIVGQPHLVHKFFMIKDVKKLKWGPFLSTFPAIISGLLAFGVGMTIKSLVLNGSVEPLQAGDDAITVFLLHYAGPVLTGMAFAGVASAVMSTANSFVNVASASIVRDFPAMFGKKLSDQKQLFWGRVTLAVCGVISTVLALTLSEGGIALLGAFGYGTFAAALAPAIALGFNWKRATRAGAVSSIATGLILGVFLELSQKMGAGWYKSTLGQLGMNNGAFALVVSIIVMIVVSFLTKPHKLDADIEAVMDA